MHINEAAPKEMDAYRKRKAILLADDFEEASGNLTEYYSCLMEKCDPVEQVIIRNLKESFARFERCIQQIYKNGFTIQECLDAYAAEKGGACA